MGFTCYFVNKHLSSWPLLGLQFAYIITLFERHMQAGKEEMAQRNVKTLKLYFKNYRNIRTSVAGHLNSIYNTSTGTYGTRSTLSQESTVELESDFLQGLLQPSQEFS